MLGSSWHMLAALPLLGTLLTNVAVATVPAPRPALRAASAILRAAAPPSAKEAAACSYEMPAFAIAGSDVNARNFIARAYEEESSKLAHLGDPAVVDAVRHLGKGGPKKCRKADGDGNCEVASCSEDTYGEITQRGAVELLQDPIVALMPGATFVDLGCGTGRLVVDAALLAGAGNAFGVELSDLRWTIGCAALARIEGALRANSTGGRALKTRHVELRRGDMLQTDFSDADVLYVSSLCFRPALMEQLHAVLVRQLRLGTRVLSLRRFPSPSIGESALLPGQQVKLVFQATRRILMSWSDPSDPQPVFVYLVDRA